MRQTEGAGSHRARDTVVAPVAPATGGDPVIAPVTGWTFLETVAPWRANTGTTAAVASAATATAARTTTRRRPGWPANASRARRWVSRSARPQPTSFGRSSGATYTRCSGFPPSSCRLCCASAFPPSPRLRWISNGMPDGGVFENDMIVSRVSVELSLWAPRLFSERLLASNDDEASTLSRNRP